MDKRKLPPGWVWATFTEVAELLRGVSYKKEVAKDTPQMGYLPILRATNIQESRLITDSDLVYVPEKFVKSDQLLKPNDIVICMSSGSNHLVGKAAQLSHEWTGSFGTFCAAARFSEEINQKFGGYFFESPEYNEFIRNQASGVNINNLRRSDIEVLTIPLPPLAEQQRIVDEIEAQFTRLDAVVTALKRAQTTLKRYRASVLKTACEGRLVPQNPSDEPASQLLERILAERRQQWNGRGPYTEPTPPDTSDLPELPVGWVWTSLESISDAQGGYAFKSNSYTENGFQIVKIGNVDNGSLNLSNRPSFISNIDQVILQKYLLKPGDILITLTGTRGKRDYGFVALIKNEQNLLLNQRVARLRFHSSLNPTYFWIALQNENFQNRFFKYETGIVGQGNVGMKTITIEAIPLPPLAEQQRIVEEVERRLSVMDEVEATLEANLKRAERLRQSILKRAFEGKLVSQNPVDEPASVLLGRIREAKAKAEAKKEQLRLL